MNRWQACTEIIRAFLQKSHPLYALLALGLIVLPPVVAGIVIYSLGKPAVAALNLKGDPGRVSSGENQ